MNEKQLLIGGVPILLRCPVDDPTFDQRLDLWGREHRALVRRDGDGITYRAAGRLPVRLPPIERNR